MLNPTEALYGFDSKYFLQLFEDILLLARYILLKLWIAWVGLDAPLIKQKEFLVL